MNSTISDDQTKRHIADVWDYVEDVRSGKRKANRWEKLAVDRFVKDIDRQGDDDWPWVFDEYKAARPIRFMEKFPHVKGHWAKLRGAERRIRLQPWQKFIVANLFGWVSRETGLRRFNEAYVEIPRKNGKSMLAALIGLYMLAPDGEAGAEVYCGATSQKQALEVFKPAKLMAERQPHYRSKYAVAVNARDLKRKDESIFQPVIGKPGDGSSPSCAIVDEYHEHQDETLYSTMDTGMLARLQPILLVITTAGDNLEGPCHRHQRQCKKVLDGLEDERLFVIIFTIDRDVPWDSPDALEMANPNLGVSVTADKLRHDQVQASKDASKAGAFKTKHLNIWIGAKDAWMNMEWWYRQEADIKRAEFTGCRNVSTLDLSSKYDITARADMFERREDDGKVHYYLFGEYYVPEATAQDPDTANHIAYMQWIEEGYLKATDGDIIDYEVIEDDAARHVKEHDSESVGYDPWGATETAQRLQKEIDNSGADTAVVEIQQNTKQLSEPMKMFHAMVKAGRLHHDGNPVLSWMVSNIVAKEDANENIYPNKEGRESKIDGGVAGIMAKSLLGVPDDDGDGLDDFLNS